LGCFLGLDGGVGGDGLVDGWEEGLIVWVSDPADDAVGGDDGGEGDSFGFEGFEDVLIVVEDVGVADGVFLDVGADD